MIEQYLYARSASNRITPEGLRIRAGFGCVACTQGITEDDANRLDAFAQEYPFSDAADGNRMPLYMKFTVGKDGSFAVGKTSFVMQSRPSHTTHQYLFTGDTALDLVRSPDEFFRLPFISEDVDGKDITLLQSEELELEKEPLPEKELRSVLSRFDISGGLFKQIICAAYDCREYNRKLIFAVEGDLSSRFVDCASLLYHIYRFLPFHMRMALGFDTGFSGYTGKNAVDLSFVSASEVELGEGGICRIGERNCAHDYIILNGKMLHISERDKAETDASLRFLSGVFAYMDAELLSGYCNDERLSAIFAALADLANGIPFNFLDDITTYNAMFAAMEVFASRRVTRKEVSPLIRFYLAVQDKLSGRVGSFWASAVIRYLREREEEKDDTWILRVLCALYCSGFPEKTATLEMLAAKLSRAVKTDEKGAVARYFDAVQKSDDGDTKLLARRLFSSSVEIEKAFIADRFSVCCTAGELCQTAAAVYHVLGAGNAALSTESEISEKASEMLDNFIVTADDIEVIRALSQSEPNEDIRSAIHILAADALDRLDLDTLPAEWFRNQKWSFDFIPFTVGGVTTFLVRDMLCDTSSYDPDRYLSNFTYVPKDEMREAMRRSAGIVYGMIKSGELPLDKSVYPLLVALTSEDDGYVTSAITDILAVYPSEIPDFIIYFGSLLPSLSSSEWQSPDSLVFAAFLDDLKPVVLADTESINLREIIVAVNTVRKNGVICSSAVDFNAALYDEYQSRRSGASAFFARLFRKGRLVANRSTQASTPWFVSAVIFLVIIAAFAGSLLIFGNGAEEEQTGEGSIAFYAGEKMLTYVRYEGVKTAEKQISLAESKINYIALASDYLIRIGGTTVKHVMCEQQYLIPYEELDGYSSIGTVMLEATEEGSYNFNLKKTGTDIQRAFVCITVEYGDGTKVQYGFIVNNLDYIKE